MTTDEKARKREEEKAAIAAFLKAPKKPQTKAKPVDDDYVVGHEFPEFYDEPSRYEQDE